MYHIVWSPISSGTNRQQFVDVYFHFVLGSFFCLLHGGIWREPRKIKYVNKHEIPKTKRKATKETQSLGSPFDDVDEGEMCGMWAVENMSYARRDYRMDSGNRGKSKQAMRWERKKMCSERDLIAVNGASDRLWSGGRKKSRALLQRFLRTVMLSILLRRDGSNIRTHTRSEWNEGET